MDDIFYILDWIIFLPFVGWIMYILVFALGYRFIHKRVFAPTTERYRYLVVFPAYREDAVIVGSITNFVNQDYPKELYKVVVVADTLAEKTLQQLYAITDVEVLIPSYTNRSKAAALKMVLADCPVSDYDGIVILDADNHVDPSFLCRMNDAFAVDKGAYQAHRVAKNQQTDIAYLDGLSEEINNSIFRLGHNNLNLPSGLSGSGMLFEIGWFKETMFKIDAVGEDKELEYHLLKDRLHTTYLDDIYVYDEKISGNKDFSNQRKRWIAAQVDIFLKTAKDLGAIIKTRNWAMFDKLIQWSMPPRILLLAWGPFWIVFSMIVFGMGTINKWVILYFLFALALFLALPNRYYVKRTCYAFFKLPSIFIAILRSLVGLKSARTTFIHTPHGFAEENDTN